MFIYTSIYLYMKGRFTLIWKILLALLRECGIILLHTSVGENVTDEQNNETFNDCNFGEFIYFVL